ncbi:MAG: DNA polymerase III subunit gamma and tau [Marmoricola sp.]
MRTGGPNLALYRKYRSATFAEVMGQDHVTEPLRAALAARRINHAYLFSGPRGCGKTSSARILARSLNCLQGPTPDPCGVCDSCKELAPNGPGSIDVIEIDAASHGLVDDARDLRERAFFAPVRDRYKVYIVDEAHMVTTQAFNALLKLVEEPPDFLVFVFATTEPDKVLTTIRSRTHHYPFRLIPPRLLSEYLSSICETEGVSIEPAALPLVVRAGAGSARDSLSVLDQLLAGAGPEGVTYEVATRLLGYTPDALLDEVVDAFAAADGATVFRVVDKVIETGQDPRRFTEDVLRRLRDLVIVSAVPDAPASGLVDVPEDAAERLVAQAARFGKAELVRAADTVADGLTEMRGATTPRLLLELICARVLLPGTDLDATGLAARMDRLERRLSMGSVAPADERVPPGGGAGANPSVATAPAAHVAAQHAGEPSGEGEAPAEPDRTAAPETSREAASETKQLSLADVRRIWPDVLERVKQMRRFTWILLSQNAQALGLEGSTLTVGLKNAGARDSFLGGGSDEILRQAAMDVIGSDWKVEAIVDPSAEPSAPGPTRPSRAPASSPPGPEHEPTPPPDGPDPGAAPEPGPATDPDADVDPDDPESGAPEGADLLARELGATVIEEINHE